MIQDVDESLRALVKRDALNGSKADVAFDAPNKEWSSRRNTPTVDLYLYDIREDLEQREVMWEDIRGDSRDSRLITERRPPPRRFKLSYLVTAWTQRPEDEHRLLSSLLACFLRNPIIPEDATTPAARGGRARRGAAAAEAAKPVGAPGPGGPKASGRLKPGEPANKPGVPPDQEEMVRSGKEKQPGRILRIRGVNRS